MVPSWIPPPSIAEFRLERRLGRGATSNVWLAHDTLLNRVVALKIANVAASAETRTRFRVEARAVAKLQHPNLLAIHYTGEVSDRPFLVTEFLSGQSLDDLEPPLAPERVVAIGIDLARGVAAAHRVGVVHRDIKPANAFLCDDGVAKLLDFGLAQLSDAPADPLIDVATTIRASAMDGALDATRPASWESEPTIVGTPLYMAPETWRGEPATCATDVYSLGAVLFEMLAGEAPSIAGLNAGVEVSLKELGASVSLGQLGNLAELAPCTPPPLAELIRRCLSLDRDKRPDADELCDALVRIAAQTSRRTEAPDDPRSNPYRGLLAFGPEQRALFFGREAETAAVVAEMHASPFVLIVGPSGTGKSSLVRAGVVPRIEKGALGPGGPWHAAVVVPGRRPTEALADAAARILRASPEDVRAELVKSRTWLADELRAAHARVALVVDQLEEIWTLAPTAERDAFFEIVGAITQSAPTVRVVATLRADFLDRLETMGKLQALALRALVVLRPMTPDGLRRAIVEPAQRRGVTIEPPLVDRLMAATEAGSLPLLEFALGALYARRDPDSNTLGLAALDALGGVEGALAVHADAALARLPATARREARKLLLALVTVERTRWRREERDLVEYEPNTRAALDALVEARLVVASAGEHGAAYEVAHEALLSGWPTLQGWLDDEAAARAAAARVRRAQTEWERAGRAADALFGERQLADLDALAGQTLDAGGHAFVAASRAAVRRARGRRWALISGIPLLLMFIASAAWSVSYARRRTAVARAIAQARELARGADETAGAADDARARAFARFEQDDLGPAEALWQRTIALEEDTDRQRRAVGTVLDEALAIDPRDVRARSAYADVTLTRLLSAERRHKGALERELRARLEVYDDGSRAAVLSAPARVRVETEPPAATLSLARYREDSAGRLVETDRVPLAAGITRELEGGSYLIEAEARGRAATRYPFVLRRGEASTLRVTLPRAVDVPEGMIYVPEGRFLYGSDDDEETRALLTHVPMHEVDIGAFLIARTEVTNDAYLTFLSALSERERQARLPAGLTRAPDGGIAWNTQRAAANELFCIGVQSCVDWRHRPVDGASREDAEGYAAWLASSGRLPGARLCRDREWEHAARGADGRRYPGGSADPGATDACVLATYGGLVDRSGPCAPGTHVASRSPFGVDDMEGSEWEWTAGPADIARPLLATSRSGGWNDEGLYLFICNRGTTSSPKEREPTFGIRVCADVR